MAHNEAGGQFQRADIHIHTKYSDGYLEPEEAVEQAARIGLNVIAITDHDRVLASLIAREYAFKKGLPVEVLTGFESSAAHGHILALGVEDDIPKGLSAEETLYLIHEQGGITVAAHPGQSFTQSLKTGKIMEIYNNPDPWVCIDASEVLSSWTSRIPFLRPVNKSGKLYNKLGGAMGSPVSSSDAHFLSIGLGETHFPSGISFREAVKMGATIPVKTDKSEARNAWQMAWFVGETVRWTAYEDPKRTIGFLASQWRKRIFQNL
jgi:hypothetical protein